MRRGTLTAVACLTLIVAGPACFCQARKVHTPTSDDLKACDKFVFASAYCAELTQEFYVDKTAAATLKPSLSDPADDLTPFVVGQRKDAILKVATMDLKNTAANDIQQALTSIGNSTLQNSAQVLSTKATVNQTGASPTASGSTSLVSKPTTTDLISLAAESGAFTDTVNGNTLTAQANADGLRRYLSGKPFADLTPTALDLLQHINVTATFTVAQSGSSGVSTSGSATSSTPSVASVILPSNDVSFDSLSVNYALYRPYNPRSPDFVTSWQKAIKDNATALAKGISAATLADLKVFQARIKAETDPTINKAQADWLAAAKEDEANNDFAKFVADYAAFGKVYVDTLRAADPANYDANILAINTALESMSTVNGQILDDARGKPLFTLVYTYSTPQNKPATHTATFVGAYVWKSGTQLTGNAAGTWFANVPTGATYGTVQSYQFAGELDQPLGSKTAPRATLSVAGYGQYQYNPTVLNITSGNLAPGTDITLPSNAQVLLGTAGWLGVAQAKLVFNVKNGISIPVAFKWSSKTDLLPSSDWKGQFGISYDFSSLSSMLSGKN